MNGRKGSLITLILCQLFYLLLLPLWFLIFVVSAMAFDAPGSERQILPWVIFWVNGAYPLAAVAASVIAWIAFARRRFKAAIRWNLLPMLWIVPVLLFFLYANLS